MIFFLVGPFYPLRGGIAQYLAVLGKKLEEKGHQVKILSFRKQFPRLLFPGQTQREESREFIRLPAEAVFIPWNPWSWIKTFQKARKGHPDALIFKYWMPFFAPGYAAVCGLLRYFTEIPVIFILDNVIPHEKHLADRFLTRLALRWVDAFIVQSEVVRRDLLRWFPEAERRRIALVPHPIYDCYSHVEMSREEARRKLGISRDKKLLLFFGLVRHYKGLDILLEAMPAIISRLGLDAHLLIAGEFYDPEISYRQQVEKLRLAEQVTIVNRYIRNEEVSFYFRAADLLVLPYRSATQSGVIQVANYFLLPVVSTAVGGLPEIIREGETGFLVEPESPAALTRAVVNFFQNIRSDAFAGGLENAKNRFSWENMLITIEDLARKRAFSVPEKKEKAKSA